MHNQKKLFNSVLLLKLGLLLVAILAKPLLDQMNFFEANASDYSVSDPVVEQVTLVTDVDSEPVVEIVELTPTPEFGEVKMLAFGDMLLDRYVRTLIERDGLDAVLAGMQDDDGAFFDGYDFVFTNLEGPVTPTRVPTGKLYAFQFDPEFLDLLVDNHFNIVSVANNHTFDMGQQGNDDTYKYLEDWGIQAVGDAREVNERSTFETEVNGYKVGFGAYNHTDFKTTIEEITASIEGLAERNDFVIASIHWGVEYQHTPQPFQEDWAQQMVDAGADVILGHHPHVLQGMEVLQADDERQAVVFYSLGNFVFDQWFSEPTQETIALGLEFRMNESGQKFVKLNFTPLRMNLSLPFFPNEEVGQQVIDNFYDYSFWTDESIEDYKILFEEREIELEL